MQSTSVVAATVRICPRCSHATYLFDDYQFPPPPLGAEVGHLPDLVEGIYREARQAISAGAHTAGVLALRKLLMNIAVAQGAEAGKRFAEYVEYLAAAGYVPPNGQAWVDHIRNKGNEATHEIALMKQADAEELLVFTEMLLRFVYEFPSRVPAVDPGPP